MNKSSFMDKLPPLESRGRGRCAPTSPPAVPVNTISPAVLSYSNVVSGKTLWTPTSQSVENKPRELRRPNSVTPAEAPSPETALMPPPPTPVQPPVQAPVQPPVQTPVQVPVKSPVAQVMEAPIAIVAPPVSSTPSPKPSVLSVDAKEFVPRARVTLDSIPINEVKEFVPRSHMKPAAEPDRVFPEFVPRGQARVPDIMADEFVPRQQRQDFTPRDRDEAWEDLTPQAEYHRPAPDSDMAPKDVAVKHLIEVIEHITLMPESFDQMVDALTDAFTCWMEDEETTVAVVDTLFEQSLVDANFRFNGVRLCSLINNKAGNTFRTPLLRRCNKEHTAVLASVETQPARTHGYLLLVSDLFVSLEVVPGSKNKIEVLGRAAVEVMRALLDLPTHDNVKCVCQTLKLAGFHLSTFDKESVDALFTRLHKIHLESKATAPSTKMLIQQVQALRRDKWGFGAPPQQPVPAPTTNMGNGPVFYGPDGSVLTQEENQFLQDNASSATDIDDAYTFRDTVWEQDEEMDEEIQAAFEQFLRLGKK